MAWRGFRRLAAAAAVGIIVLLVVTSAQAIGVPSPATPNRHSLPPHAVGPQGPVQGKSREAALLTGCERQLQPGRRPSVPTVAIVGASFTAGVGAEDPAGAWAVLLARQLNWNAFVYGVPGAGYVHPGLGRKGPGGPDLADALRAACATALPRPKRPTEFCLVPELPLGATGKVSRRRLRELAMAAS